MQAPTATIVAIATPSGAGAIGVIRLSGPEAIAITQQLFKGKNLAEQATHTLHFGHIVVPEYKHLPLASIPMEGLVDEVVISLFKGPKSYTGEDTIEISCHGSSYILQRVLQLCITAGAELASPGAFTQRAFLNGKMDLTQAEAVADLIASSHKTAHDIAMHQMRGGFSKALQVLRDELIHFAALIELELDFSQEDVAFADRTALIQLIEKIEAHIQPIIQSFKYGNVLKAGIPVAIVGKPNAGKSTLLNALLQEDRAIVSAIAGTTRDTIEEVFTIDGFPFRLIDTAGLRDTEDVIEKIGIEKAKEKMEQARIILYLIDAQEPIHETVFHDIQQYIRTDIPFLICLTKLDLISADKLATWSEYLSSKGLRHIAFAAKTGEGLNQVQTTLSMIAQSFTGDTNDLIVTNERHHTALLSAMTALHDVKQGMEQGLSGDLLSLDIRRCLYAIGSITGSIQHDRDILGAIFGKFCIGK
ncbi:MAG: tRNA uridine-5-carboxymethylaminomethyl(34) synthesis GTPase MnmE [Bacteroidota bacterium]|nr:tRNA uridine-5-carboxymethylaminomethyl(34) synthesis GTPase MnmE [Bacteroidota bacterium]